MCYGFPLVFMPACPPTRPHFMWVMRVYCVRSMCYIYAHINAFIFRMVEFYLSIDGLFGHCRKKVAGKSVRSPLYTGKYFEVQKMNTL